MKQTSISIACISLLFLFLGCNVGSKISEEEAGLAFGVTTRAFMSANLSISFRQEVENASYNEEDGVMTFTNFSFDTLKSNLKKDFNYTSMSGTVRKGLNNTMIADLNLAGGQIKNIKYQVSVQIFNGILPNYFELTINGKSMKIKPGDIF
ncbi:MAG: hypothetical protein JXR70_17665 [Spirochaetales bacterium]|nr:hypothetical protein [Spirochaetales bacterium]